jgi:hypothetical protein
MPVTRVSIIPDTIDLEQVYIDVVILVWLQLTGRRQYYFSPGRKKWSMLEIRLCGD